MLMTSKRRAVSGLSSTLSLPMVNLPRCSVAISARVGAIILHGPHHSAQKSTSTGVSEPARVSSNVASERLRMSSATGASFPEVGRVYRPGLHSNADGGGVIPERRGRLSTAGVGDRGGGRVRVLAEPAFGFDCGHATGARGGDRLSEDVILDVTCGEHAL